MGAKPQAFMQIPYFLILVIFWKLGFTRVGTWKLNRNYEVAMSAT